MTWWDSSSSRWWDSDCWKSRRVTNCWTSVSTGNDNNETDNDRTLTDDNTETVTEDSAPTQTFPLRGSDEPSVTTENDNNEGGSRQQEISRRTRSISVITTYWSHVKNFLSTLVRSFTTQTKKRDYTSAGNSQNVGGSPESNPRTSGSRERSTVRCYYAGTYAEYLQWTLVTTISGTHATSTSTWRGDKCDEHAWPGHTIVVPSPGHREDHENVLRPIHGDTENQCLHSFSSCFCFTKYNSGTQT